MRTILELLATAGIGWFVGYLVSMFFLPPEGPGTEEADKATRDAYEIIVKQPWFQKGIRKGVSIVAIVSALVIRLLLFIF